MLRQCNCSTTTATGPMLSCRQDVAMMQKQEERHRDKQSTLQRYEFHFTSIQRTSSVTYFAVRKKTQHKLPQLKLGPTICAIGLPVAHLVMFLQRVMTKVSDAMYSYTAFNLLTYLKYSISFQHGLVPGDCIDEFCGMFINEKLACQMSAILKANKGQPINATVIKVRISLSYCLLQKEIAH